MAENSLSHLCGVSFQRHYTCVNPYHLVPEHIDANEDRKGCRYGNAFQCPHVPKCRFTNGDTGLHRPCVSGELAPPLNCIQVHDGSCYETGAVVRDDLSNFRPSTSGSGAQPSSQTHYAGQGPEALQMETDFVENEARARGEFGLPRFRSQS